MNVEHIPNFSADSLGSMWMPNIETGFLLASPPPTAESLAQMDDPCLSMLGSETPRIGFMTDDELDNFVKKLPIKSILSYGQQEAGLYESAVRAYVAIAAHLIHRSAFSQKKELPESIAVPLWNYSAYLGRPPSLTYASYVLANYESKINKKKPPDEIKVSQTVSGLTDESWFIAAHTSVESTGGSVVESINNISEHIQNNNLEKIPDCINNIKSCMEYSCAVMSRVVENMDPERFRTKIRPFLYGHDKIKFIGTPGNQEITYIGETGAQSGVIRAVDLILGVTHQKETQSSIKRFVACAPPSHKEFFNYTEILGNKLTMLQYTNKAIQESRNDALSSIKEFRRIHLDIVRKYLIPNGTALVTKGTGGTQFENWLGSIINETDKSKL